MADYIDLFDPRFGTIEDPLWNDAVAAIRKTQSFGNPHTLPGNLSSDLEIWDSERAKKLLQTMQNPEIGIIGPVVQYPSNPTEYYPINDPATWPADIGALPSTGPTAQQAAHTPSTIEGDTRNFTRGGRGASSSSDPEETHRNFEEMFGGNSDPHAPGNVVDPHQNLDDEAHADPADHKDVITSIDHGNGDEGAPIFAANPEKPSPTSKGKNAGNDNGNEGSPIHDETADKRKQQTTAHADADAEEDTQQDAARQRKQRQAAANAANDEAEKKAAQDKRLYADRRNYILQQHGIDPSHAEVFINSHTRSELHIDTPGEGTVIYTKNGAKMKGKHDDSSYHNTIVNLGHIHGKLTVSGNINHQMMAMAHAKVAGIPMEPSWRYKMAMLDGRNKKKFKAKVAQLHAARLGPVPNAFAEYQRRNNPAGASPTRDKVSLWSRMWNGKPNPTAAPT